MFADGAEGQRRWVEACFDMAGRRFGEGQPRWAGAVWRRPNRGVGKFARVDRRVRWRKVWSVDLGRRRRGKEGGARAGTRPGHDGMTAEPWTRIGKGPAQQAEQDGMDVDRLPLEAGSARRVAMAEWSLSLGSGPQMRCAG